MNKISMAKILLALSGVIDLVSNTVVSHHKKVRYLTYQIAKEMNLNEKDLKNLVMAALIHDIGVFYIRMSIYMILPLMTPKFSCLYWLLSPE